MSKRIVVDTCVAALAVSGLACSRLGAAQTPVFFPAVDIDQPKLLQGCTVATSATCGYKLKDVLNSGGHFWTTPFQPYDPVTKTGDGYGEGPNGPRAAQRHFFNPSPQSPAYRFLRMNGLDSQSCFECHNSIGSVAVDSRGALIRKPYGVGGSAGSNSNAFINPLYPKPETLFIRNPPAVFGSGYQQAVGDEMTLELLVERYEARLKAKQQPGMPFTQALTAKGIPFGQFITTYLPNTQPKVLADPNTCKAGSESPASIGAPNYTDDLRHLEGVSCDLVIRPFQWKGVTSSLRHFVRDALDFHFSMQAFEKVGFCDCDRDGKGTQATGPEVTIGEVSAMVAFVGMTRPPIQKALETSSEKRGRDIFLGNASGLYQHMCANCHVPSSTLLTPNLLVEWPVNAQYSYIDPSDETTWPIREAACPGGVAPPLPNACPIESSYSASTNTSTVVRGNRGALVTPLNSSRQLSIVHRFETNLPAITARIGAAAPMTQIIKSLRAPLLARVPAEKRAGAAPVIGQDYVIPLSAPDSSLAPYQLYRLPAKADGTVEVPLFSDLKRHKMGRELSDPSGPIPSNPSVSFPSQGTDVADINTLPEEYMTRPLWGVADTGPWMHDGRAMTLMEAVLMHGDTSTGSEAAPVVEAFKKLSAADKQAVVDFLLTLRLPEPAGS